MAVSRSHAIRVPPSKGRILSYQHFAANAPASLRKPQAQTTSAIVKQLRRSSSVYSRATRCWDEPPLWPDESPPPPIPRLPLLGDKKFSESSPELSSPDVSPLTPNSQETLPHLLESRTYQPILPSPSPSIAPTSLRKLSSAITNISALLAREDENRVFARRSFEEIQLSPSPPPMSPVLAHRYSVSSFEGSIAPEVITMYRSKQARGGSSDFGPVAMLSGPFDYPATDSHRRVNSVDRALAHMRLGSDVTDTLANQAIASSSHTAVEQLEARDETLLSDYRDKLVDEYKELAAPPTRQWHDDAASNSDAEVTGHELRIVPQPLFWENRQKELYPQRAMYAQQKQTGKPRKNHAGPRHPKKHKMKLLLPNAPLQMILPSQYKRRSTEKQEDSPTTAALKKALALRLTGKKRDEDLESTEGSPRLFHGKRISKPIQDGPMPLQLPKIAYRDVEAKMPTVVSNSKEHVKPQYAWRSSGNSTTSSKGTPITPWPTHIKEPDAQRTSNFKVSGCLHPDASVTTPRGMDRSPSPRHMAHLPPLPSPGLSGIFHNKAKASPSKHPSFEKGHGHKISIDSVSSSERRAVSAFSPVDDERLPGIFDRALEVMRERGRDKRRKNLKSQIKFVGRIDPEKINQEQGKPRRETFREGRF